MYLPKEDIREVMVDPSIMPHIQPNIISKSHIGENNRFAYDTTIL